MYVIGLGVKLISLDVLTLIRHLMASWVGGSFFFDIDIIFIAYCIDSTTRSNTHSIYYHITGNITKYFRKRVVILLYCMQTGFLHLNKLIDSKLMNTLIYYISSQYFFSGSNLIKIK